MYLVEIQIRQKYKLLRSTMQPKFNPPGVRIHDLQMDNAFHVPETPLSETLSHQGRKTQSKIKFEKMTVSVCLFVWVRIPVVYSSSVSGVRLPVYA